MTALAAPVTLEAHGPARRRRQGRHAPAIVVLGVEAAGVVDHGIRLVGAPLGYELTSLVDAIVTVAGGDAALSRRQPGQAGGAGPAGPRPGVLDADLRLLPARPSRWRTAWRWQARFVTATAYSVIEFPDLIRRYRVTGVPKIVDRRVASSCSASQPEAAFVDARRSHAKLTDHGCHRHRRRHQDLRHARRRRRPLAQRRRGLDLRLHRAERLGQDDDAADDHEHPAARPRRDPRARAARDRARRTTTSATCRRSAASTAR